SSVLVGDTIAPVTCPATTNLGNAFVNDGSSQLAVGDGILCTASYTLQQVDLDAGEVINVADVASTDPSGANVLDEDTVNSGFTQKTSVALIKSATRLPSPATVGDLITYTFTLTNTGNVTLSAPQVTDPICATPVGPLTFNSGYVSGDAGVAGEMEAGETWEFSCLYAINQDDVNAGEVANTATGSGTPPASSGLPDPSNMASNLAEAEQNAAIAMDKSSSLPTVNAGVLTAATDIGDTINYSFSIENTGNVTLANVTVVDPLITGAPNNGIIACPDGAGIINSMSPAEVVICTASYAVTQANIDIGTVANTATVTGTPPPSVPPADNPEAVSASVVTIAPMPDLEVVKSVSALVAPLQVGDVITYTFVVENTGNVTVNNVIPLDSGPTFNGAAASSPLSAFSPPNANLAPGVSQSFTATYTLAQTDIDNIASAANPLTAIDNSASATGEPVNGTLPSIDPSTSETGVVANPSVELSKSSIAPAIATEGADITYTFMLENTGNVTISNPVVNDAKCATPGAVLSFSSGYVAGDGGIAEALDVGEIWEFSCIYPISQTDINAGTVNNMATGGGQDPAGDSREDDASVDTPLTQTSSWTVNKSTTSTPSVAGDSLVYQFVVDNTGNVDITDVSVSDAKCAAAPVLVSGDIAADSVLSPTETWVFACTSIAVTQMEVDNGVVDNQVDVSGSAPPSAPPLAALQDTESTPIVSMPALSIDKSSAAPTIGLGVISSATDEDDIIEYMFEVSNNGNVTISALAVDDSGPTFGGSA
ncbi:DUF11 domain-containing protein, partial [Arenicella sp.]|nr:DUF11 domain-containing protein [Arenicella sp.]